MPINNRRNIPREGRRGSRLSKRGSPNRRRCCGARRIRSLWPPRKRNGTNKRPNSKHRDSRLCIKGHGETRREQSVAAYRGKRGSCLTNAKNATKVTKSQLRALRSASLSFAASEGGEGYRAGPASLQSPKSQCYRCSRHESFFRPHS